MNKILQFKIKSKQKYKSFWVLTRIDFDNKSYSINQ